MTNGKVRAESPPDAPLAPSDAGRLVRLALALAEPGESYDSPLSAAVRASIRLDAFMESQRQSVESILHVRQQERETKQDRARAAFNAQAASQGMLPK